MQQPTSPTQRDPLAWTNHVPHAPPRPRSAFGRGLVTLSLSTVGSLSGASRDDLIDRSRGKGSELETQDLLRRSWCLRRCDIDRHTGQRRLCSISGGWHGTAGWGLADAMDMPPNSRFVYQGGCTPALPCAWYQYRIFVVSRRPSSRLAGVSPGQISHALRDLVSNDARFDTMTEVLTKIRARA